jgi:hypothetical protein
VAGAFGQARTIFKRHAWQALLAYTAGSAAFDSGAADFEYGLARILDGLESRLTLPLRSD